jgi:hypothetical protein
MFNCGDIGNGRVFHVEVVFAHEHHRQLPDSGKVECLMEGADVCGAVAEETDRDIAVATVLSAPGGAASDGQVSADDGVRAHHAMLDRGQMHRAALAAHQAVIARHEFAQHLFDRHAACQRVRMAPVGAEAEVAFLHGHCKPGRDGLLAQ